MHIFYFRISAETELIIHTRNIKNFQGSVNHEVSFELESPQFDEISSRSMFNLTNKGRLRKEVVDYEKKRRTALKRLSKKFVTN